MEWGSKRPGQYDWQRVVRRMTVPEQSVFFQRMRVVESDAPGLGHDYAIRLMRLSTRPHADDEVWVVIRRGEVKTVMLRRSTQSSTPRALRVDRVVMV